MTHLQPLVLLKLTDRTNIFSCVNQCQLKLRSIRIHRFRAEVKWFVRNWPYKLFLFSGSWEMKYKRVKLSLIIVFVFWAFKDVLNDTHAFQISRHHVVFINLLKIDNSHLDLQWNSYGRTTQIGSECLFEFPFLLQLKNFKKNQSKL